MDQIPLIITHTLRHVAYYKNSKIVLPDTKHQNSAKKLCPVFQNPIQKMQKMTFPKNFPNDLRTKNKTVSGD
jgi:hypothetical protein